MSRITYVCQLVCGYKEKLAEQVKLSLQTLLMGKKKGKNNRAPKIMNALEQALIDAIHSTACDRVYKTEVNSQLLQLVMSLW